MASCTLWQLATRTGTYITGTEDVTSPSAGNIRRQCVIAAVPGPLVLVMAREMPATVTVERAEMAADMHRMPAHAAAARIGREVRLRKDQHREGTVTPRGRFSGAFSCGHHSIKAA